MLRLFSKPERINVDEEKIDTRSEETKYHDSEVIEDLFEEPEKVVDTQKLLKEENKDKKTKEKKGIDKVNLTDAGKTMILIQSSVGVENQTQD